MVDIDAVQKYVRQDVSLAAVDVREASRAVNRVIEALAVGDDVEPELHTAIEMTRLAQMRLHGVVAVRNAMRAASQVGAH